MYYLYKLKFYIEQILLLPFILIGRFKRFPFELDDSYRVYFFFPFYHIGGAERVNLNITQTFGGVDTAIIITRHSHNEGYLEEFRKTGCKIFDVSTYTDDKTKYWNNLFFRGYLARRINHADAPCLVFNGQSNFGYKISPWIRRSVKQLELVHSFNSFSWIRIPYISFYSTTVMISRRRIADHLSQYERLKIPSKYARRIRFIMNGIDLPYQPEPKLADPNKRLKVLYVGRATAEKRVHLVAELAKQATEKSLPLDFVFMGEVAAAIPPALHSYCTFLGNQTDPGIIRQTYESCDILILLSTTEGFPVAIMEAMAYGLTIIATSVGEIPEVIGQGENGYVIEAVEDEAQVKHQAFEYIEYLCAHREELVRIADNNTRDSKQFSILDFSKAYRDLYKETIRKR